MNSLQLPAVDLNAVDRSGDDLDARFRSYFRAQLPEPWPVLKPPATPSLEERNPPARSRSRLRSRVALAAALTALLIGQWFVSGLFSNYVHVAADGNRDRIEATNRHGPVKAPKLAPAPDKAPQSKQPGNLMPGRR